MGRPFPSHPNRKFKKLGNFYTVWYSIRMAIPRCSICARLDVGEIDAALVAGGKLVATAERFGLTKSALHRHKTNCLAPKIAAAAKMLQPASEIRKPVERARAIVEGGVPGLDELLGLEGLLGKLARSLDRLEAAADDAAGTGLHGALAALSGQIHRGIESTAKLRGLYVEPELQQWPAFSIQINLGGHEPANAPAVDLEAQATAVPALPQSLVGTHDTDTNFNGAEMGFEIDG